MPKVVTDFNRKFFRWYFASATQPTALQSRGVALKLYADTLFSAVLCHAVLKDISYGGAGVLVPASAQLPEQLLLVYAGKHKLKAKVVYRRQISDKLSFLGLRWLPGKEQYVLQLLRTLSKKAYRKQLEEISEQHEATPAPAKIN
ncbi:PilZ domain-containing protein [Alishewanella sp. BS5-314]|uniref:PilZ domain-containing protein n=1 Tax=Alishewanella sp. BS5-314 TaxID=2755587 RepID=UPI0021BA5B71|nr:PilZ domain-containing protein [Alishewanella sp. BS5-314]MCT8125009.1 PilZ domain-containing protein [Alishewanella sp. BS5-314]